VIAEELEEDMERAFYPAEETLLMLGWRLDYFY